MANILTYCMALAETVSSAGWGAPRGRGFYTRYQPAHHGPKGFRNPWPGYGEPDYAAFLSWKLAHPRPRPGADQYPPAKAGVRVEEVLAQPRALTWIGHNTFWIRLDGVDILTDPFFADRASPVSFAGPRRGVAPAIGLGDLPPMDIVLISHDHYDHLDKNAIRRLGPGPHYLAPLGLGKTLRAWGARRVTELDWWHTHSAAGVSLTCVPAQHFSGRGLFGKNATLWCGWVARRGGACVYFAGDTGYFPGFAQIGAELGPVDTAILPIGSYQPEWFMGPVHLSPAGALAALDDLDAGRMVAAHHATITLAEEDAPAQASAELRRLARARRLAPGRVLTPAPGETLGL